LSFGRKPNNPTGETRISTGFTPMEEF
jgi:hypothetical protein